MTKMARAPLHTLLLAAAGWLVVYGCKKEEEVKYPATPPIDYTSAGGMTGAGGTGAATALGDAGVTPDAAAEAGPAPLNPLSQQLLEERVTKLARQQVAGMKAVGDLVGGVVAEGGQIEVPLMIAAQKCYSVVAVGGSGVTEVDIQIVARPGAVQLPAPVIAQDMTQGAEAVIKPCWKNVFPVAFAATAIVKATKGAGELAGRAYVK